LSDVLGASEVPARTERSMTAIDQESLDDVQRLHIVNVLKSTKGVVEGARGAATVLGMNPNTLRSRMKKLGIATSARGKS
jgi:formate hydrogenlyase transcriptional activator